MMKYLQKLGKALMLPVACLPICGILMGIGYALCPSTMQGGDVTGIVEMIGFFLVKAGGALIDNMAILFVIGVGVGMADDNDGTAGLAALASWLMMTNLLSVGTVTTLMPAIADNATKSLAFGKIANPFIGILAGIIGATCYNKFKGTKLPDWLSFFSGKRCVAIGLVASSALCAFVCGVTEPFEFGFMFLAPALYVVYAVLYGIFTVITVLVGFRAGFSFSAGATDLIFSASLPAAKNTWMIIPLGIAAFIVFYVVFRFAITKFDLKTPGREDDDVEAEKKVDLGSSDYTTVAATILEGVGGAANVTSIDNCITRLRLEVKDSSLVDEKKIKSAGAAGVIRPSKTAVQVVVGTKVQFVADEFKKLCK